MFLFYLTFVRSLFTADTSTPKLSGPDNYNSRPFLDAWAYSVFEVWRSIGNSDKGNYTGYKSLVPVILPFVKDFLPTSGANHEVNDTPIQLDPLDIDFDHFSYPHSVQSAFKANFILGLDMNAFIGLIIATCCSFLLLLLLWIGLIVYHCCWCCAQCCQCCAKCCNCCCRCCRVQKPCCTCGCWTEEGGKPCYKHLTRICYTVVSLFLVFAIVLSCVSFFRIPYLMQDLGTSIEGLEGLAKDLVKALKDTSTTSNDDNTTGNILTSVLDDIVGRVTDLLDEVLDVILNDDIKGIKTTLNGAITTIKDAFPSILSSFDHFPDAIMYGVEDIALVSGLENITTFKVNCTGKLPSSHTSENDLYDYAITDIALTPALSQSDLDRFVWIHEFVRQSAQNYTSLDDLLDPVNTAITNTGTIITAQVDSLISLIDRIHAHLTMILNEYIALDMLNAALTPISDAKTMMTELKDNITDILKPIDPTDAGGLDTIFAGTAAMKKMMDLSYCLVREAGLVSPDDPPSSTDLLDPLVKPVLYGDIKQLASYDTAHDYIVPIDWLDENFVDAFETLDSNFKSKIMSDTSTSWFNLNPLQTAQGRNSESYSNDDPLVNAIKTQIEGISQTIDPSMIPIDFDTILADVDAMLADLKSMIAGTVEGVGDMIDPLIDSADTQIDSLITMLKSLYNSNIAEGVIPTIIQAVCFSLGGIFVVVAVFQLLGVLESFCCPRSCCLGCCICGEQFIFILFGLILLLLAIVACIFTEAMNLVFSNNKDYGLVAALGHDNNTLNGLASFVNGMNPMAGTIPLALTGQNINDTLWYYFFPSTYKKEKGAASKGMVNVDSLFVEMNTAHTATAKAQADSHSNEEAMANPLMDVVSTLLTDMDLIGLLSSFIPDGITLGPTLTAELEETLDLVVGDVNGLLSKLLSGTGMLSSKLTTDIFALLDPVTVTLPRILMQIYLSLFLVLIILPFHTALLSIGRTYWVKFEEEEIEDESKDDSEEMTEESEYESQEVADVVSLDGNNFANEDPAVTYGNAKRNPQFGRAPPQQQNRIFQNEYTGYVY
ncbi:hypothetical protein BLNAU_6887 [Blattamonas nauphoetae]|uniref:Uncharacterized protein n=1 Tax=Blattamonas nauphoetae TaxID=2049346 RepID=A0ABQ9Y363_9EUKA|nr:hypothetical protein BLNAU_6887 [Blattamonas nauphoetae]